jgi:hypothetical protein
LAVRLYLEIRQVGDKIVFADCHDFDLKEDSVLKLTDDGVDATFVIADSLSWRFAADRDEL